MDGGEEVFPTSQKTVDKENDFIESKMVDGYYVEFYNNQTNASVHTFTLDKLRHFSQYSISVLACRDFNDPLFNVNTFCSNAVMINRRTEKIGTKRPKFFLNFFPWQKPLPTTDNADDILQVESRETSSANSSKKSVKLSWQEPKNPNGLILSYTIIYKRVDLDNVKPTEQCITRHMHQQNNEEVGLLQLSNGNYSVSVRATSLAGDGRPTEPKFIIIDVSVEKLSVEELNKIDPWVFYKRYGYSKKQYTINDVKP